MQEIIKTFYINIQYKLCRQKLKDTSCCNNNQSNWKYVTGWHLEWVYRFWKWMITWKNLWLSNKAVVLHTDWTKVKLVVYPYFIQIPRQFLVFLGDLLFKVRTFCSAHCCTFSLEVRDTKFWIHLFLDIPDSKGLGYVLFSPNTQYC